MVNHHAPNILLFIVSVKRGRIVNIQYYQIYLCIPEAKTPNYQYDVTRAKE